MIVNVTPSSNKGTNHFEDENEQERGRCGNILRQQQTVRNASSVVLTAVPRSTSPLM